MDGLCFRAIMNALLILFSFFCFTLTSPTFSGHQRSKNVSDHLVVKFSATYSRVPDPVTNTAYLDEQGVVSIQTNHTVVLSIYFLKTFM